MQINKKKKLQIKHQSQPEILLKTSYQAIIHIWTFISLNQTNNL